MSLKKDIVNLIKSDKGSVKINEIIRLHRWTKNAIGEDVDCLMVSFSYIGGTRYGCSIDVASRTYDGIIEEISVYFKIYMRDCTEQIIDNIRNGYY